MKQSTGGTQPDMVQGDGDETVEGERLTSTPGPEGKLISVEGRVL